MIPSFSSSDALRQTTRNVNRNHLYMNLPFQNIRYRLRTKQFLRTHTYLSLWTLFWINNFCIIIGYLLDYHLSSIQTHIFSFGLGFIGSIPLLYALNKLRHNIQPMLKFSIICLSTYFIGSLVMQLILPKMLLYPTIIYISLQFIGSLIFLNNRSHLFGKCLIMIQLLFIVLKLDVRIQAQWPQVLFGFIIAFFIMVAIILSTFMFLLVNHFCLKQIVGGIKNRGLVYIMIHLVGFMILTAIPTFSSIFEIQKYILPTLLLLSTILLYVYTQKYRTQILLFLCNPQKIKDNNQNITLIIMNPQKYEGYVFMQKTDHWYQMINHKQHQQKKQLSIQSKKIEYIGENQCLVCFENPPQVVWMPCGHCCVCEGCTFQMLSHKSSCCILCKDIPQAIYLLKTSQLKQNKQQIDSEYKLDDQIIDIEQDMKKQQKIQKQIQKGHKQIYQICQGYSLMIN